MTTLQERLDEAKIRAQEEGKRFTSAWFEDVLGVDEDDWEWDGEPSLYANMSNGIRKYYLVGDVRVYGLRYQFGPDETRNSRFTAWFMELRRVVKTRPWIFSNKVVRFYTSGDAERLNEDMATHPDRQTI